MTYGQRLIAARNHAKLSQAALAEEVGISQANISKLEKEEESESEGSKYTAQIAHVCGVNAYWLATGKGEMLVTYDAPNERIRHAVAIMEQLPEYALDQAVKGVDSIAELVSKASNGKNSKSA